MNYLSALLARMDRKDEAELLYRKILTIRQQTLGETHPHTLRTMVSLGHFRASQGETQEAAGNWAQASSAYREAAALCAPKYGESAPFIKRLREAADRLAETRCMQNMAGSGTRSGIAKVYR
jgi:hypothetical protein